MLLKLLRIRIPWLRRAFLGGLAAGGCCLSPLLRAVDYTFVAGTSLGRWDQAATWSPNGNPGPADRIVGFTAGAGSQALNLYGNRGISNLTYSASGSDLATMQIRPTVDSHLTLGGDLTVDYGGGNLRILPNSSSSPQAVGLTIQGNLNVLNGTLDLGAGTMQGLASLVQTPTGIATVGGALNLHLRTNAAATLGHLVLQGSGTVTLNTGADGSATVTTVSSLAGDGGSINGGTAANRSALLRIVSGAGVSASYAGTLQNGHAASVLSLTKAGDGTQILGGARTYTGVTTVEGGTLRLWGTNYTADITSNTLSIAFSNPPADGDHVLLGGPLQTSATPTITGLGANQSATLDAATSTVTVTTTQPAPLQMPPVFSDHMILQRDTPVPVWGTTEPGVSVTVTFAGQQHTTVAGADGAWTVTLNPSPASSEPQILVVSVPGTQLEFTDVLVGEVWLCAGQSNMYRPIAGIPGVADSAVEGYEEVLALPENAEMRLCCDEGHPLWNGMQWQRASSNSLSLFSGVGYFFGKKIQDELGVPVGLMLVSRVGTTIQAWTPKNYALQAPVTAYYYALYESNKTEIQAWNQAPEPKPELSYELQIARTFSTVGGLYNNWMAAQVPFSLRGVLWYQGESNGTWEPTARHYDDMLHALAAGLRGVWDRPDLPFYFVQLPVWAGSTSTHWPWIRQTMLRAALSLTNCGMAVTLDVGELNNAHPPKKREVGERLALWALDRTYGSPRVVSGPWPSSAATEAGQVRVEFNTFGLSLSLPGGTWTEIEAAGHDGVFHPATATLSASNALLTCPQVSTPVYVRYGWKPGFTPTLFNTEGLPATPFCLVQEGGTWRLAHGDDLYSFTSWAGDGATITPDLLRHYAIGGAVSPSASGEPWSSAVSATELSATAIVRRNDPRLSVVAEVVTDLPHFSQPAQIITVQGSPTGVSQAGVPAGCERQVFRIARNGLPRVFLRLKVNHAG